MKAAVSTVSTRHGFLDTAIKSPSRCNDHLVPASEQGRGASAEGNRPFVDVLDLETRETERLWRSQPPFYESTGVFQTAAPHSTHGWPVHSTTHAVWPGVWLCLS